VFLYVMGEFQEFIVSQATGTSIGGGPGESLYRLVTNQNISIQLDATPTTQGLKGLDFIYQFALRRFLNVIPDVERFSWDNYVTNGFNVGAGDLFVTFVWLVGYLLPWLLAGYYLMMEREIAA
jgi:hypothetical protein